MHRHRAMVGVTALALMLSSCTYKASGGGWFNGATAADAKQTVGLSIKCSQTDVEVTAGKAEISFIDRDEHVNLFASVNQDVLCAGGSGEAGTEAFAAGTYRPRPKGDVGTILVFVTDTGARGPSKGDSLELELIGGAYDGYRFSGTLAGGNFTVKLT